MQDGRGGQQHVQRGAHQAEGLAVDPVLVHQLDGAEGHHQHRHQQVGERQRHDEVVGLDFPGGGRRIWRVIFTMRAVLQLLAVFTGTGRKRITQQ